MTEVSRSSAGGGALDVGNCPELTGPHHLVLVEKEDRDASGTDQLRHLWLSGPVPSGRISVGGSLANPMGLVAEQDVETVAFRVNELIEVLEQRADSASPGAGHSSQRLCEGAGAGRVQDRPTLPREFTQE